MPEARPLPFGVRDCALISRTAGLSSAVNLREMRERLSQCSPECLFHHLHEAPLRVGFDDPEFRNDLAVWAARDLRDRVLAERLGILNPYQFEDLEILRQHLVELVDERLAEIPHVPWAPKGREFHFLQAVTVVFDAGLTLEAPEDLSRALPGFSTSSVYYHFLEARRRTPDRADDFSVWLRSFSPRTDPWLRQLAQVDYYFLPLDALRDRLAAILRLEVEHA
jgi:hypothetical protein